MYDERYGFGSRIHDIFQNRVLRILDSMNYVSLYVLPEENPWNVDEFIEKMEEKSNQAACVIRI